jgi:hypothetical protein
MYFVLLNSITIQRTIHTKTRQIKPFNQLKIMSGHGQKVSNSKEGRENPVYEGGFVTKDSLAAESINDGGSYGEGNPHNGVSSQPSKSSNLNTEDTSAAEELGAASSSGKRQNFDSAEDTFDSGRIDPYTHKALGSEDNSGSFGDNERDNQQRNEDTEDRNENNSYENATLGSSKNVRSEAMDDNEGFGQNQVKGASGDFNDTRTKKEIIEERRTNIPVR